MYQFGTGETALLLVGAIHGGYEWNTALLAYQLIDHLKVTAGTIPADKRLYIIPVANPDGLFQVTGNGGRFTQTDVVEATARSRFNANGVDLNRNWACEWAPVAQWGNVIVSGGDAPFSEPETVALRDFILAEQVAFVLFWHSVADGVYAAGCPDEFAPSLMFAEHFGKASGYPIYGRWDVYPITGDAGDWLATIGIPAITVELSSRTGVDWAQNWAGVQALLAFDFSAEP